jgi:hypothetical protein
VGPRADLDDEDKFLEPTGIRTPTYQSSNPLQVAIPSTLFRLPISKSVDII